MNAAGGLNARLIEAMARRLVGISFVLLSLKRQLSMIDLCKILASKLFVESSQIQVGYARFLRTAFWLRLLQISIMFNCRFKDYSPLKIFKRHSSQFEASRSPAPQSRRKWGHPREQFTQPF